MGHDGRIIAELTAMYVRGELTANEYEHAKLLVEKEYGVASPPLSGTKQNREKAVKAQKEEAALVLRYHCLSCDYCIQPSDLISKEAGAAVLMQRDCEWHRPHDHRGCSAAQVQLPHCSLLDTE